MKKYTAKDIREQRISFEKLTCEQAKKLLTHFRKLYPGNYKYDIYIPSNSYWRFYENVNTISTNRDYFFDCLSYLNTRVSTYFHSLIEISFEEFDFEEEFILPENWHVVVNDTNKLILNLKNTNMEKKIIGYKVPFDITLLSNLWKAGEIAKKISNSYVNYTVGTGRGLLPTEIVEKWEPVYEEKKKVFIGEYEVILSSTSGNVNCVVINGLLYSKGLINDIKKILFYNSTIKSVNVGCNGQYKVDLAKIEEILSLFND